MRIFVLSLFIFICGAGYDYSQAQEAIYDSRGNRNPFIPLVTSDGRLLKLDTRETKGKLVLEGITYAEKGNSYALINGEIVQEGDIISDSLVVKIENNRVLLTKDNKIIKLDLFEINNNSQGKIDMEEEK